eukprot:3734529-Prymnesium_polylepis.2
MKISHTANSPSAETRWARAETILQTRLKNPERRTPSRNPSPQPTQTHTRDVPIHVQTVACVCSADTFGLSYLRSRSIIVPPRASLALPPRLHEPIMRCRSVTRQTVGGTLRDKSVTRPPGDPRLR